MILNYQDTIKEIQERIEEYKACEGYKDNNVHQNIVYGLDLAIAEIGTLKRRGCLNVLTGLDKRDLLNLESAIQNKLKKIENESKVKLWKVEGVGIERYHFKEKIDAINKMGELTSEYHDDDMDSFDIRLDVVFAPESEIEELCSELGEVL